MMNRRVVVDCNKQQFYAVRGQLLTDCVKNVWIEAKRVLRDDHPYDV